MAWDEWEQLKADAKARAAGGTQLNSSGNPGNGVKPDLVAHQDDLGAVGHEAFILHGDLKKQVNLSGMSSGQSGESSSGQAAKVLSQHHFSLGSALSDGAERWGYQTDMLLQACAHISNHLDYTKSLHRKDDEKIEATFTDIYNRDAISVSRINESFK